MIHGNKPTHAKQRVTPGSASSPERIKVDLEQVKILVDILEAELEDQRGSQSVEDRKSKWEEEDEGEGKEDRIVSLC
jgi:hypothetical protein